MRYFHFTYVRMLVILASICMHAFADRMRLKDYLNYYDLAAHEPLPAMGETVSILSKRSLQARVIEMTMYYRSIPLQMTLQPDQHLLANTTTGSFDSSMFLKGSLKHFPNSIVRLNRIGSSYEGVITFGKTNFGPLFVDSLQRYEEYETKDGLVSVSEAHSVLYRHDDVAKKYRMSHGRGHHRRLQARMAKAAQELSVQEMKDIIAKSISEDNVAQVQSGVKPCGKDTLPKGNVKGQGDLGSGNENPSATSPVKPRIVTVTVLPDGQAPPPRATPQPSATTQQPAPVPTQEPPKQPSTGNICRTAVIADHAFFLRHQNEPGGIENYMIGLMNQVSGFYEQQLGISMQIVFHHVEKNPASRCGFSQTPNEPDNVVPFINKAAGCLPNFPSNLCIGMVFSGVKFRNTAVGVANVGAICLDGSNTGIASDVGIGGSLPRPQFLSVVTHEIGHMFGSPHDRPGSNCDPGTKTDRFVMFPSVQSQSKNAFTFSSCSIQSIRNTIEEPRRQCWKAGQQFTSFASLTDSPPPEVVVDYM